MRTARLMQVPTRCLPAHLLGSAHLHEREILRLRLQNSTLAVEVSSSSPVDAAMLAQKSAWLQQQAEHARKGMRTRLTMQEVEFVDRPSMAVDVVPATLRSHLLFRSGAQATAITKREA